MLSHNWTGPASFNCRNYSVALLFSNSSVYNLHLMMMMEMIQSMHPGIASRLRNYVIDYRLRLTDRHHPPPRSSLRHGVRSNLLFCLACTANRSADAPAAISMSIIWQTFYRQWRVAEVKVSQTKTSSRFSPGAVEWNMQNEMDTKPNIKRSHFTIRPANKTFLHFFSDTSQAAIKHIRIILLHNNFCLRRNFTQLIILHISLQI